MKAAEAAAASDAAIVERVKMAQLPVMYAYLQHWKELREEARAAGVDWPLGESPDAVGEAFMAVAKRNGVTRLCEWQDGYGLVEEAVKRARQ